MKLSECNKANRGSQKVLTPENARPDFRNEKVLHIIFFNAYGPIAKIPVPKGERLNGEFYANKCLRKVVKVYVSKYVKDTIEDIGFETIEHPPYIPDISQVHFWLFPEFNKQLRGQQFRTRHDLGTRIYHYQNSIDRDEF